MKNVKLISFALSMLVSFVVNAQKKTLDNKPLNCTDEIEIPSQTFIKFKDTISGVKVSPNFLHPSATSPTNRIIICAPSRSALREPMYILDGVIINSKQFSKINPNDIEEIKVLKDPEATSLYGNQALNGVVVIITKED